MANEDLTTRLMRLFLGELEDHERTLEQDLLQLERAETEDARRDLIEGLFRAAHSLKGAARAVNAGSIEGICHRLEHTLSELRGQGGAPDKALMQRLFGEVDAVKAAAQRLRLDAAPAAAPRAASAPSAPARPVGPSAALAHAPTTAQATAGAGMAPPMAAAASQPAPSAVAAMPSATGGAAPAGAAGGHDARATRIATHKLDALLARSSELVVATTRIETRLEQISRLRDSAQRITRKARGLAKSDGLALRTVSSALAALEHDIESLDCGFRHDVGTFASTLRHVDDEVRRMRMVPFREAFEGLDRSVRDLARSLDKDAHLASEGEHVEMDREVVQRLRDPLLHLVRNAVSHGIERRADRAAQGKAPSGRILLSAALRGGVVELCVEDDGRGLDFQAIRERARALGLPEVADDEELSAFIFAPGFSTAKTLDEIAGRGVGLDAVKRSVEALHGTVTVNARAAQGARFVLRVPLTMSKLRCLFVRLVGQHYAIPTTHAVRVLRFRADELLRVGGNELVRANDELVPVVSLSGLLGLRVTERTPGEQAEALVVSSLGRSVALIVSELVDERESILQKLPERLAGARFVSGATMRARGQIAPVLNGSELGHAALASLTRGTEPLFRATKAVRRRVLVADDSITTRALMKSIVEEGGYEVVVARDGKEAFRLLNEQPFDLVVSDVQMPNLDGYGLTEQVRATPKLARIPVVLVTSLESERDRLRGLQAGANAYLGKSAFDHRVLLEVIGGLL